MALVIFAIAAVGMSIASFSEEWDKEDEFEGKLIRAKRCCWLALAVSIALAVFVPSRETYLFMVGGKVVDEAVKEAPQLKELPGNTLDLLNEYIQTETERVRSHREKKH